MPYYPTLREDIERAKAILAKGKMTAADLDGIPVELHAHFIDQSGTIFGMDIYAAYKLLESFVEVIETMDVKVCEQAIRARKRGEELTRKGCTCIIVNGEYRSTSFEGCPVHPKVTR